MSKMTPQIRFQGFTDDWEERKLGDIFNYEQPTKYIVKSTEYDENFATPVLTAGKSFLLGYTDEINGIKNATVENPVVIFDDFTTGSHYVDFPFKIKSSAMKLLSLNDNSDNFYFMFNTLKNIKYVPQSHERHWISKFSEFEIYKPSEEEQQKIGSFFKQLDNTITLHQRKLDLLKEQKKGFLQKMFPKNGAKVPELRFEGFTDDWEERKLKYVASYRNGKAHEQVEDENGKFTIVNSKFISTDGKVKRNTNEQVEPMFKGELAIVLSDLPNGKALAKVFLVNENEKYTLNQRIAGITPKENCDSKFLSYRMNRHSYFLKFDSGVSQTNLSKPQVEEFVTLYPSFEEQQKIGSFFKQLDDTIALHQRKLNLLTEQKKGFLQKMFVS
ncbi:restriction endonuclease subunit S [Leuconostoc gasicomitatum]|uniref:restriction endonuclease subunit S n=1 Tax=Leuconostoc gasicomitatum TaxID=115778 RepID=UPI001CC6074E|nr:restriction endonuclease subunit S [Leuconostoc gasicomitatum]MBZ5945587.1 restriction endonuclease subunit S [Leuconostoc gasicomitatum]